MDFRRQKKAIDAVMACAYLVCFFRFIPIRNQIGDEGVGLFAAAFLIYLIYSFLVQEILAGAVARMINVRMKREQYRNAGSVFDFSLIFVAALGVVVCGLVYLSAGIVAEYLLLMPHADKVIRYMAPAFTFTAVSAMFSAYLRGVGDTVTDALLKLGSELLITLLCLLMSGAGYRYGISVDALLKQGVFGGIYGAHGCGLAVSLGSFLMMLVYLLCYAQAKVDFKRRTLRDVSARDEEVSVYMRGLFINSAYMYAASFLLLLCLICQERMLIFYVQSTAAETGQSVNAVALYGRYFEKGLVFIAIPLCIIYQIYHGMSVYIRRSLNQDDRRSVRETLQLRLRKYCIYFIPAVIFLSVFANPLVQFWTGGETQEIIGAVRLGALSIFFFGLAYMFSQVCAAMDKQLYILASHAAALIIHILVLHIGLRSFEYPVSAMGLAGMFSAVMLAAVFGILLPLQIGYRHYVLHYVKPLISAAASGLIGMMIVMLFADKVANIITLIFGGVVFVILYMVLMAALHGLSRKELGRLPGGEFLKQFFYHNNRKY